MLRYVTQQIKLDHNEVLDTAVQVKAMVEYAAAQSEKCSSKTVHFNHQQITELQRVLTLQLQSLEKISDVYTEPQLDDKL